MATELINKISVKKDGVYISTHSSNDNAPYHSVRIEPLSNVYNAEGKKGLDREIIRMLCEYGELRGNHHSLSKYYYALNSQKSIDIRKRYLDLDNYYYSILNEDDKNSLYSCNMSEKAKEYREHSKYLYNKMYSEIAEKCYEYDLIVEKVDNENSNDNLFEYYQKIISNILDVSKNYCVDFDSRIPFQDFGSDKDAAYGTVYSFSNYYREILECLNININNISTDGWSDGKYKLIVNEEEFKITAGDNFDAIVDNVNSMIELFQKKYMMMEI